MPRIKVRMRWIRPNRPNITTIHKPITRSTHNYLPKYFPYWSPTRNRPRTSGCKTVSYLGVAVARPWISKWTGQTSTRPGILEGLGKWLIAYIFQLIDRMDGWMDGDCSLVGTGGADGLASRKVLGTYSSSSVLNE